MNKQLDISFAWLFPWTKNCFGERVYRDINWWFSAKGSRHGFAFLIMGLGFGMHWED